MKTSQILNQAWHNVLHYRTLWLFGMVLALVTASWGSAWMLSPQDDDLQVERGITIQPRADETFWQAWDRTWDEESARFNRDLREIFAPWKGFV